MKENRRDFLRKSGCALSMLGLATQAQHFGLMSALAQNVEEKTSKEPAAAPTDYRALVCILLEGGNDGNNLIVPNHSDANISNYSLYASSRSVQGLALAAKSTVADYRPQAEQPNIRFEFQPRSITTTGRHKQRDI